jgi:hypothetical protein
MPELPRQDVGDAIFGKIAGALAGQVVGEVPEADKLSVLEALVDRLDELCDINETFAVELWDKFGDEESGDWARKPDLRDFLSAWALATLQVQARRDEEPSEEDGPEGGGKEPGGDEPPDPASGPGVVEADFRVLRSKGKKS